MSVTESAHDDAHRHHRTVMAWASGGTHSTAAAIAQLQNASWAGMMDGIQAFCGVSFSADGLLHVNETQWDSCATLRDTCQQVDIEFHVVIGGTVPQDKDPRLVIDAAVALAKEYRLHGFSLDDESDCAPRSTLNRFQPWMAYVNALAQGLQEESLQLSAAVQAMFGIQDVPYHPYCHPDVAKAECSQACRDAPSSYSLEPRVTQLLSESKVDRWLEMDTYYFTTGRFLNTLDWYTKHVPRKKLGVAMMNRNDLTEDGLLARFHAIDKSRSDWINMFMLPVDDVFLPYLQRWKSHCAGCGVQSVLGCYDMSVSCNPDIEQPSALERLS